MHDWVYRYVSSTHANGVRETVLTLAKGGTHSPSLHKKLPHVVRKPSLPLSWQPDTLDCTLLPHSLSASKYLIPRFCRRSWRR